MHLDLPDLLLLYVAPQALAPATEDQAEQMDKPEAEVPGEDAEEGDDVAAEEPQEDEPMEEAEEGPGEPPGLRTRSEAVGRK